LGVLGFFVGATKFGFYQEIDAPLGSTCLLLGDRQCPTAIWLAMFWQRVGVLLGYILNHENGMMIKCVKLCSGVSNV